MALVSVQRLAKELLESVVLLGDVQFRADAAALALTESRVDVAHDEYRSVVTTMAVDGSRLISFGDNNRTVSHPCWAPSGRRLAMLSRVADAPAQLAIGECVGGALCEFTNCEYGVGSPIWSPDETALYFVAPVPATQVESSAAVSESVGRLHHKLFANRRGLDCRHHLFALSLRDAPVTTQLTHGDFDVQTVACAPNGRSLAFSRIRESAEGELGTDVCVLDLSSGHIRSVSHGLYATTHPSWSPDGKWLACFGASKAPHFDNPWIQVWVLTPNGERNPFPVVPSARHRPILGKQSAHAAAPLWAGDGESVYFRHAAAGNIEVVRASVLGSACEVIVGGPRQVLAFSLARDRLAFVATDGTTLNRVLMSDSNGLGETELVSETSPIRSFFPGVSVERRSFDTARGSVLDGWVIRSKDSPRRGPLLLSPHGGPHGFVGNSFLLGHLYRYLLAARGWTVLTLNSSGSGSYGADFTASIRGRWGTLDWPEWCAAEQAMIRHGDVDPDRVAIAGYSYGGYLAAWAIGHSNRLKAAVVGAPISNIESFMGTSDIGAWFIPWHFDKPRSRGVLRSHSPLTHAHKSTTPTLIVHGEADTRCPIGQAEELHVALRLSAQTPVSFVRYPGADHDFPNSGRASQRVDYHVRVFDWLEHHVRPSKEFEDNQTP